MRPRMILQRLWMALEGLWLLVALATAQISTDNPTTEPTVQITPLPSSIPSFIPSSIPTRNPTAQPSMFPTSPYDLNNTNARFCATFDPKTTDGATGYFAMQIKDGVAKYAFNIDLTNFLGAGTCSLSTSGMKYHIHSFWNNATATSTFGPMSCGSSQTGGHYDPDLGCSPTSQYASTACANLGRTAANGYTYACNSEVFSAGDYALCEVGDLSGKYGNVYPSTGTLIFSEQLLLDYYPPYIANYMASIQNSIMWSSVVYHCGIASAPRIFCAELSVTNTASCSSAFEVFNAEEVLSGTDNPDDIISNYPDTLAVGTVVCVVFGVIVGVIMSQLITYYVVLKPARATLLSQEEH